MKMRIEQEWEGYVVDIGASEFVARLVDLTAGSSHEEEEAIIPVAQISDHDAARLPLGSIFRWVIGYETSAVESQKWVSRIVFRDLPKITKNDLREGRAWAAKSSSHWMHDDGDGIALSCTRQRAIAGESGRTRSSIPLRGINSGRKLAMLPAVPHEGPSRTVQTDR